MTSLDAATATLTGTRGKAGLLLLVYTVIWAWVLCDYLPPTSLPFVLAVCALPFTLRKEAFRPLPAGWLCAALLFLLLSFLVPVKTLLYFTIGSALFLLLPMASCRPTTLSIAVWVVASPAFQYVTNVFSFPIRLQLTNWAGQLLSLSIKDLSTRGNVIYYGKNEFAVDPACMGLNMLITSLLVGIMTLGYFQLKRKRRVGAAWALLFMVAVLGCNVGSNLVRIILLVLFAVWPGTLMHELVGLACLAIYVLLPSVLLAKVLVNRLGLSSPGMHAAGASRRPVWWLHYTLAAFVAGSAARVMTVDTYAGFRAAETAKVAGYKTSAFAPGILKLESDNSLVYVKYVRGFYDTDHNPSLCWKGSGYEFQQVEQKVLAGRTIYTAVLVNGGEKLYTAWWYSNGRRHTINQWEWRYDALKGAPSYAVINVTTADEASLQAGVEDVIQRGALLPLFKNP